MYVEGDLLPAEQTIMEAHLAGCVTCRKAVVAYKALLWDLEHPAEPEVPAELQAISDRLMSAWEEAQVPGTWQEASRSWTQTVPVVSLALGAAGQVGQQIPRAGAALLKGLGRRILQGGGRR